MHLFANYRCAGSKAILEYCSSYLTLAAQNSVLNSHRKPPWLIFDQGGWIIKLLTPTIGWFSAPRVSRTRTVILFPDKKITLFLHVIILEYYMILRTDRETLDPNF
jgi:hypothetical protein